MPVLVEILVRDVARVLLSDVLQSRLERRIGLEEQRAGLLQPVDEIQHAGDGKIRPLGARGGQHAHQRLHRHHRGPPGGDIVAEIDQAARLQPPGDHRHQMAAVGRRDPAQHAVRDHEIEVRQRVVRQRGQVGERGLDEMRVAQTGARRQCAGELDMRRIEVEPPDLRVRAGGRDGEGGKAVAAAKIGVAERPREVRRAVAEQQAGHAEPGRCDLAVEVAGIGHVGHVAVVPMGHAVGHSGRVLLPVLRRPGNRRRPRLPADKPLRGGQPAPMSAVCSSCAFSSAPSSTA